jgi:putative ABC transport system permease protein
VFITKQVVVGRLPLKVVGVMQPVSQDQDPLCVAPMSTGRALLAGSDWLNGIGFMAVSTGRVAAAVTQANQVLDPLHRITSPGARDYTAQTNLEQIRQVDTYLDLIKWFTVAVAVIALFIGGIGVANIMVATVTERTNEIGIRKAIGARRGSILRQFLIESIAPAGLGGVGGVLVGVGLVQLGARLLPRYAPAYGTPELSWVAIALAFAISLVIGLGAGGLPAYRAARMRPIDALPY